MSAKNDQVIDHLINDNRYQFRKTGEVLKYIKKTNSWRDVRTKNSAGYYVIAYQYRQIKAHRATWAYFYGNLEPHLQINHKDGNKLNNSLDNLELVTSSENLIHRHRCLNSGKKRLTFDQAKEIRSLWNNGIYTHKKLAEKYDCTTANIEAICAGRTFKTTDEAQTNGN